MFYHENYSENSLDLGLAQIDLQGISYLLTSIATACGNALWQKSEGLRELPRKIARRVAFPQC